MWSLGIFESGGAASARQKCALKKSVQINQDTAIDFYSTNTIHSASGRAGFHYFRPWNCLLHIFFAVKAQEACL